MASSPPAVASSNIWQTLPQLDDDEEIKWGPPPKKSAYQLQREETIRQNNTFLASLGLGDIKARLNEGVKRQKKERKPKDPVQLEPTRRSTRIAVMERPNYKEEAGDDESKIRALQKPGTRIGKQVGEPQRPTLPPIFPVGCETKSDVLRHILIECRRANHPGIEPLIDLCRQLFVFEYWSLLVSNCHWDKDGTLVVDEAQVAGKLKVTFKLSQCDLQETPGLDQLREVLVSKPFHCALFSPRDKCFFFFDPFSDWELQPSPSDEGFLITGNVPRNNFQM